MHLVLTGATGLVGAGVLHNILTNPAVQKVSILSRRPVPMTEGFSKANVIIHKDFSKYDGEVMKQLRDVDGVVWALGISSLGVGKEDYEAITNTYPLAFARSISEAVAPKPIPFIYVSGEGATFTPGFMTSHWQTIKGKTEIDLIALSKEPAFKNLRPLSLRPGGVDPSNHPEIEKFIPERGLAMRAVQNFLVPVLKGVMPSQMSPTKDLGRVLMELAMGKGERHADGEKGVVPGSEGRVLSNVAMRRLAGI